MSNKKKFKTSTYSENFKLTRNTTHFKIHHTSLSFFVRASQLNLGMVSSQDLRFLNHAFYKDFFNDSFKVGLNLKTHKQFFVAKS